MPKLTFGLRNASAVTIILGRRRERLKANVRQEVSRSAIRLHDVLYERCPVDTGWMHDHIRTFYSPKGFSYSMGWIAADFGVTGAHGLLQTRAAQGRLDRRIPGLFKNTGEGKGIFYPPLVILGTRFMPARNFVSPAWREELPRFEAGIRRAIKEAAA